MADDRKRVKLRIRALLREERLKSDEGHRPWTKAWLDWVRERAELGEEARWVMDQHLVELQTLEERIKTVEQRMEHVTRDDPLTQALLKQPGVGLVTAFVMRAEIGSFHRFRSGKQLARFCSVTPLNASSGKTQADAGLVRQGNTDLRHVLIQAAQRLGRYDERWSTFKAKLVARGKPASVAVAAIANRWIRRLFHQIKQDVAEETSAANSAV